MSAPPLSSVHEFHKKFTFHASVYRTEWWQGRPGGHKPLNKQTCKHSAAHPGPSGTCACGQGALGHVPFARGMPGFPWDLGVCHLGAPSRAHALGALRAGPSSESDRARERPASVRPAAASGNRSASRFGSRLCAGGFARLPAAGALGSPDPREARRGGPCSRLAPLPGRLQGRHSARTWPPCSC